MNGPSIDAVVKAVLYEGYILYPYRPSSVKNRQRWTFGNLYPQAYRDQDESIAPEIRTECLLRGGPDTAVEVHVRFLHLLNREIGLLSEPVVELAQDEPRFTKVSSLRLGGKVLHAWEEAVERDVTASALSMAGLACAPKEIPFIFSGRRALEPLRDTANNVAAVFIRSSQSVAGVVTIATKEAAPGLFKLTVRIQNTTPVHLPKGQDSVRMQHEAFASTHTILGVRGGRFVSLIDPPDDAKDAAAGCSNLGTWPVLAGEHGSEDTMLSSPIILYDYPQVAPESPGDLFDATEIDEILTLRILGMTDEEKREMVDADERARALLERTEGLNAADMERLHGALREPRFGPCSVDPAGGTPQRGVKPELAFLRSGGRSLRVGDRVRLHPKGGADIMDIVLKDELAVIEAIERDFEDRIHIAVVLEADPGREYGLERMPGHRFFFSPGEVEAVEEETKT